MVVNLPYKIRRDLRTWLSLGLSFWLETSIAFKALKIWDLDSPRSKRQHDSKYTSWMVLSMFSLHSFKDYEVEDVVNGCHSNKRSIQL